MADIKAYKKAKETRSKSIGDLIAENVVGGKGVGSSIGGAILDKTKANAIGLKESLSPMGIAKSIGGNAGAALFGRLTGQDQDTLEHFTERDKDKKIVGAKDMATPEKLLGEIYKIMQEDREDVLTFRKHEKTQKEDDAKQEQLWHSQLIAVLSHRKEEPEKKAEEKKKEPPKKEPPERKSAPKRKPGERVSRPSGGGRPSTARPAGRPAPSARPAGAPPSAAPSAVPSISPGVAAGIGAAAVVATGTLYEMSKSMIKRHEGVRNQPYKDSLGLWTVGVGHLIGDGKSLPAEWNRTFSDKEVDDLFSQDYNKHMKAAEQIPGYEKLNDKGKAALIDLTFNMGPTWYKKWPSFTKSLASGDVEGAAKNLETSKWYTQVGKRAPEIVAMIRAGAGADTGASTTPDPTKDNQTATKEKPNAPTEGTKAVPQPTQMASVPSATPSAAPSTPAPTGGTVLAAKSNENATLKNSMETAKSPIVVNNNISTASSINSQSGMGAEPVNDNPAYLRKALYG